MCSFVLHRFYYWAPYLQMKWKSITHDGSTVDGLEYVTVSLRLMNTEGEGEQELGPDHKVPVQQLSLGAVLTDGKTAEEEVAAIEARMLERFSGHLDGWRKKCEEMYPDHDHPHIPESQGLAWHRLADGGSVMQDACNQAQAMSNLIEDKVTESFIKSIGQEKWDTMSEEEQAESVRFHRVFCHNHLRCTCIRHALEKEQEYLDAKLKESAQEFSADSRVSTKIENVFRAATKEFLFKGKELYAKGHGMDFLTYCLHEFPDAIIFTLERADLGTRQDSSTEGAVALLMNRKYYMKFLHDQIESNPKENILQSYLFVVLGSVEGMAAIRARAILHEKVISPLRFFANSHDLDFCPVDMGPVLDTLYNFLVKVKDDGSKLMDMNLDIFETMELTEEQREHYSNFKRAHMDHKSKSIDGKTKVYTQHLVMGMVFEPEDVDMQNTDDDCKNVLQVLAEGFLHGMKHTPMVDLLSSTEGKYSAKNVKEQDRADMKGTLSTSNPAERFYGCFKYNSKNFPKLLPSSGIAQAMESINKHLSRPQQDGESSTTTHYDLLTSEEQNSLIEYSRVQAGEACKVDKADFRSYIKSNHKRQREAEQLALRRTIKHTADANRYFEKLRWKTETQVDKEIKKYTSASSKLQALKEQVNIRVKGFGWTEFKIPFSKKGDPSVGTVEDLTEGLKYIIRDEQKRVIPTEAATPSSKLSKLGVLGTLSADARNLRSQGWTAQQLREGLEVFQEDLERKKEAREQRGRDVHAMMQPVECPKMGEALVGLAIEVLSRLEEMDEGEDGEEVMKFYNQWLPATVVKVSDGVNDKKQDKAGNQRRVQTGWYLLKFDHGEMIWVGLKEEKFNCAALDSWRLDLDVAQERVPDPTVGDDGSESDSEEGVSE